MFVMAETAARWTWSFNPKSFDAGEREKIP
jgi:hypothetical protein